MPETLSDTQAADVLRRAALLQAKSAHETGVGLSLDELKRAAEVAGIEARYVEQAYLGAGDEASSSKPFLGIQTGVERVRVVPGSVSEKEWGQMVLALRREFGHDGVMETIGDVREWKKHQTRVQVEPDGPNTRITAISQWDGDAKVTSVASMLYSVAGLVAAGVGIAGGKGGGLALATLLFILALIHAAFAWGPVRQRARKRGAQFDRAMNVMERLVGSDERAHARDATPSTFAPEASGDARLDPSLLDPSLLDPSLLDPSLLDTEPLADTSAERQRLRE